MAAVDGLGVAHVKGFERALKAVFPRRNRDKMDMIVHQAVGEDIDPVFPAVARQPSQVSVAIGIAKENRLAAIPALGDVMGDTGKHGTRNPRH